MCQKQGCYAIFNVFLVRLLQQQQVVAGVVVVVVVVAMVFIPRAGIVAVVVVVVVAMGAGIVVVLAVVLAHVQPMAVVRHGLYQVRRFRLRALAILRIVQLLVRVVVERKVGRVRGRQRAGAVMVRRVDGPTLPGAKAQYRAHGLLCCLSLPSGRNERNVGFLDRSCWTKDLIFLV